MQMADTLTFHTDITKYERTSLVGIRASQISDGAKIFLSESDMKSLWKGKIPPTSIEIATMEYEKGVIPLAVSRTLANGNLVKIKPLE